MRICDQVLNAALIGVCAVLMHCSTTWADEFKYSDKDGKELNLQAKVLRDKSGILVIQEPDGRIRLLKNLPELQRLPGEDPEPMDAEAFAAKLKTDLEFPHIRQSIEAPYVVNLILMDTIATRDETKVTAFLGKAVRFFKNMESAFQSFTKQMRFESYKTKFPLAVLIFESDHDFEKHVVNTTSNNGLSASNIAGFYDPMSNHLVLRMTECNSFEVPLHESVHQQVFNRGIFQRLAPLPVWFNEGIATGFEASGDRISGTPSKPHARYVQMLQTEHQLQWDELIQKDKAFHGDILAGEAYAQAWSMHWVMVNNHKAEYVKYVKLLGEKQPLDPDSQTIREDDFKAAFDMPLNTLQKEYQTKISAIAKRSPQLLSTEKKGNVNGQQGMGEVSMQMVIDGNSGEIRSGGSLRNMSPWRPLTFHVTCETDVGTMCQWILPSVKPLETATLVPLSPNIRTENTRPGSPSSFRIKIRSAQPDSAEANEWQHERPRRER
jgi:hypothetical protein